MKYIKPFILEGYRSTSYENDMLRYEEELGVNIFDMVDSLDKDIEDKHWLLDQLLQYKKELESKSIRTKKDLLFNKTELVVKVADDYKYTLSRFKNLDGLLRSFKSKYQNMENDNYSTLIYQNLKWTVFTTDNNGVKKYVPHTTTKSGNPQFPWSELSYNIDHYPFSADNHTFIFIINNVEKMDSLLLRATWEKDFVLLDYGGDKQDELARDIEIEKLYEPLKKKLKNSSMTKHIINWVEENTKFPVYDDISVASSDLCEALENEEFEYLYGYFNQEKFINLLYTERDYKEALNNILQNYNMFKFKGKSLYGVFSEYVNVSELYKKDLVMNYLSDVVSSDILNKDLKLGLNFSTKESENDKYEKIFKYITEDDYEDLIKKYSSMENFVENVCSSSSVVNVSKHTKIDKDVLDSILSYLWGYDWFNAMCEQEFVLEKRENWTTTTNALRIVFEDVIHTSDMASEISSISSGILTEQEILDHAADRKQYEWEVISI